MPLYVVESTFYEVHHEQVVSQGVVGHGPGSEKLFLHLLDLPASTIAKLGARVDEDGNKQHDRRALDGNEEWWIAVEGEKAWPGIARPKITSRCTLEGGVPVPHALDDEERAALAKTGLRLG